MDYQDRQLLKDLDRLSKRVNAESGVPMFLACENLVTKETHAPPPGSRPFNNRFVSAFRTDAEQVQHSREEARLTEIVKIVERLAERDFALPDKGEHL